MQSTLSTVMATRGLDPKRYMLFGYGGAGPAHCCGYTAGMEFGKVVIPAFASVFSAFGASTADVKHRYEGSAFVRFTNLSHDRLSLRFKLDNIASLDEVGSEMVDRFNKLFRTLDDRADDDMKAEDFKETHIRKNYEILARYVGQLWELRCPTPINHIKSIEDFKTVLRSFETKYEELYTKEAMAPKGGVEIISIALEAVGRTVKPELREWGAREKGSGPIVKEERDVYFNGKFYKTRIFESSQLQSGDIAEGPLIIEDVDTTVVIPPDRKAVVDRYKNYIVEYK